LHWNAKLEATIVSGGGFFALKGVPQDANPRRMTVWLHEERSSVSPYGASAHDVYTGADRDREARWHNGRRALRAEGFVCRHRMNTPWDPLHRAYFNGEALWTYFTTPFLLALDGVRVEETEPWRQGSETWRVRRAYFPGSIETHSLIPDFFFGEDLMLRRHDYSVNITGGFAAAQLTSDYVDANGIRLPSKRRAYTRGPDRQPISEMLMVSIDISDVSFTLRSGEKAYRSNA
jgi:hypothetical protein